MTQPMVFDLGLAEMLVIGVVALIVVGPKDLPIMFRKIGEVTGKARRMAREFQNAMNDAARDSGVDDVAGDLRKLSNPKRYGIDTLKDATKDLTAWRPDEDAPAPPRTGDADRAAARKAAAETAKPAADAPVPDPAAPEPADRSA
ncbi:Sec-independent protein translocase protein TatB [Jannaschia sp. LMIT008]|uniref:Sec-independent protein translocase protein TatB n=1 Tax=Jannaschia maritima TaxID=3032585 RepID=UPI0028122F63|nr:Sec-independent protein translocase protein TatB [Jannaschia sp. LMIT008]